MAAGECERCGTQRPWLHRHHVKPKHQGGTDEDGIALLCANCHEDEHGGPMVGQRVRAERRRAKREASVPAETLRRLYVDEGLSVRQIAKKLKTSPSNVHYWLNDYGIPMRAWGRQVQSEAPFDVSRFRELCDEGHSTSEMARQLGVALSTLRYWRFYKGLG